MAKSNWSKTHSLVFMVLLYAFATGLGTLMFWIMTSPKCGVVAPDILALLAADLIAMLFVSIPMMEHRQLGNKPAYAEYRKSTRILL